MKNLLTIFATSVIGISSALGATLNAKTNFQTSLPQVNNKTTADDSIKADINFHREDWFGGTESYANYSGGGVIINYLDYANNWDDFMDKYPTAVMVDHIEVAGWTTDEVNKFQAFTNDIGNSVDSSTAVWVAKSDESTVLAYQTIIFTLKLWHDDQNIHWWYNVYEDSHFSATHVNFIEKLCLLSNNEIIIGSKKVIAFLNNN